MHLVEIFVPLTDNNGRHFDRPKYDQLRSELIDKFGGVTSFMRAPAHGVYRDGTGDTHDDIVIYEVMTETFDRPWWQSYRRILERRFAQDEIMIRVSQVERV